MIFQDSGVQVGSQNRSKIDQKRRSTWEGILASIFEGFWSIFGPNLGGKIHQKSMSKRMQKLTKVKERPKTEKFDFPMVLAGGGGRGGREISGPLRKVGSMGKEVHVGQ